METCIVACSHCVPVGRKRKFNFRDDKICMRKADRFTVETRSLTYVSYWPFVLLVRREWQVESLTHSCMVRWDTCSYSLASGGDYSRGRSGDFRNKKTFEHHLRFWRHSKRHEKSIFVASLHDSRILNGCDHQSTISLMSRGTNVLLRAIKIESEISWNQKLRNHNWICMRQWTRSAIFTPYILM